MIQCSSDEFQRVIESIQTFLLNPENNDKSSWMPKEYPYESLEISPYHTRLWSRGYDSIQDLESLYRKVECGCAPNVAKTADELKIKFTQNQLDCLINLLRTKSE